MVHTRLGRSSSFLPLELLEGIEVVVIGFLVVVSSLATLLLTTTVAFLTRTTGDACFTQNLANDLTKLALKFPKQCPWVNEYKYKMWLKFNLKTTDPSKSCGGVQVATTTLLPVSSLWVTAFYIHVKIKLMTSISTTNNFTFEPSSLQSIVLPLSLISKVPTMEVGSEPPLSKAINKNPMKRYIEDTATVNRLKYYNFI